MQQRPATDLFILMYRENKIFKRTTILKHVEGNTSLRMVDAMEEEEIEVISPSANGDEDRASGGVGLFSALDIGENTEGEDLSRAKKEIRQEEEDA